MQSPYPYNGIPPSSDWTSLMQRLYMAEQRIMMLTDQIKSLQTQVDDLKAKPPLHIEYHFDQLKVNRLEGTLNVGISPQGVQEIDQFDTSNPLNWQVVSQQPEPESAPAPVIEGLQKEMGAYMDKQGPTTLLDAERKYQLALDDAHRRRVVEDVKSQLRERVHYYAKTSPYPGKGTDEERQKWSEGIRARTKRDVQSAFDAYLGKVRQQTQERGAFS